MLRCALAMVLVLAGCGSSVHERDGGTQADAPGADAACPRPAIRAAMALGAQSIVAISPDPIDGSFVVGGALAMPVTQGYHASFAVEGAAITPGVRRVYASSTANEVADVFVDTHGAVTIGGFVTGPTTVDRTDVDAPPAVRSGLVSRLVAGVAPSVTTWAAIGGEVEVRATSRRGDGYFVAGFFTGALVLGSERCVAEGTDGFVVALTMEGTIDWARCFGGPGEQRVLDVAMHDAGDAYVVGDFTGAITIGPRSATTRGGHDAFVARWGGSGDPLWLTAIGTTDQDVLTRVAVSSTSVLAVGVLGEGTTGLAADAPLGGRDGAWVSIDLLDGAIEHLERVGGAGADALEALAVDRCGGAWIGGTSEGVGRLHHVEVASFALEADVLATPGVRPTAIGATTDGRTVLVGGSYDAAVTLAGVTLPTPSASAAFLLLLAQ